MAVVSNSSPLILFARMNRLELLQELFGTVVLPPAVWREVTGQGGHRPGAAEIAQASWISVKPLAHSPSEELADAIDDGEAEAIALALELAPIAILMDDAAGRRWASRLGLTVLGSVGIAVQAEVAGLVNSIDPLIDGLERAGLHLTPTLIQAARTLAGE
jgi:uncharacterized protein